MNDLQTLTLATPAQIAAEVVTILKDSGAIKPPEWLTAAQVAERLQCSKEHIERLAGRNEIPYKDLAGGIGKRMLRFSAAEIERWICGQNNPSSASSKTRSAKSLR